MLNNFLLKKYGIAATDIAPAKRGYWGETWQVQAVDNCYFVKLDYNYPHQNLYKNSLAVMGYLCDNGIDFIGKVVKTRDSELYAHYETAVLAVFEWIDGENVETDDTRTFEFQMLCKIYPLTKQGFNIPIIEFSDNTAVKFLQKWNELKNAPSSEANNIVLSMLEGRSKDLHHRAARLSHFASLCQNDMSNFYITHGDAGGNFFVGDDGKHYILDWDEVMYAPLERDVWVMACRHWARELFNDTLHENNISYELRPERLAFFCYYMHFLFLYEFLNDFMLKGIVESISNELSENSWIEERINFADEL